jgi:hypothetical protein
MTEPTPNGNESWQQKHLPTFSRIIGGGINALLNRILNQKNTSDVKEGELDFDQIEGQFGIHLNVLTGTITVSRDTATVFRDNHNKIPEGQERKVAVLAALSNIIAHLQQSVEYRVERVKIPTESGMAVDLEIVFNPVNKIGNLTIVQSDNRSQCIAYPKSDKQLENALNWLYDFMQNN